MEDRRLMPFEEYFENRYKEFNSLQDFLIRLIDRKPTPHSTLMDLAWKACRYFGFHRSTGRGKDEMGDNKQVDKGDGGWMYREWIPSVDKVFLVGDFNGWDVTSHRMKKAEDGLVDEVWEIFIPDVNGVSQLPHKSKLKIFIHLGDQSFYRIPAWMGLVWRDLETNIYDGIMWNPPTNERYIYKHSPPSRPSTPLIYEAYVGLGDSSSAGGYSFFRQTVLPRVKRLGYNSLLLLGVPEHSDTSLGWHVTNYFAPCSRFGTREELKELIDEAHGLGLYVIMSVVHSHSSPSPSTGLESFNGTSGGYFQEGEGGRHPQWDARIFNYKEPAVLIFLLSQLLYYYEEFKVDGYRFEGVSSMLFHHHNIHYSYPPYNIDHTKFFSYDTNNEGILSLMLSNSLIHLLKREDDSRESDGGDTNALSLAVDVSEMPTLARPLALGGVGFDFRISDKVPIKLIDLVSTDESCWNLSSLTQSLETPSGAFSSLLEKTVTGTEYWCHTVRGRRPLRIAMFAWESLHSHAVGGVAPHVTEVSAGLSRLGHEVHVYVRASGQSKSQSLHYGVYYHECPFQLNKDFISEMNEMCNSFVHHLKETESEGSFRFDICHAHDWLAAKALVQAKKAGYASIQTIHSTEYGRCGNKVHNGGESKRIADIEREACTLCDRIIAVSGVLGREVTNLYGIHSNKISVVYNGINAQQFDGFEDAAPIKAQYNIQPLAPVLLFVGRMVLQKGPDLLIEAIPHVLRFRNDVVFVLVGDGHMKNELISRANNLGIGGSCRFLGSKSGAELKSLFKACDAVVIPSRNEPFGIVVLEAWSAFKPVVATTCGGPRDFVDPNQNGILVDPNPESISWGCCEIIKNFDHARYMGERGRVKAAYSFSWDTIAKNTEKIYLEQLNKHDAPYGICVKGDCSLATRLMGTEMVEHMTVFDENNCVNRGLALHKMFRLLVASLGHNAGYINFMGNELGHPDYLDPPRCGNSFSSFHWNRRWDLADNRQLKYKHCEIFDACLIALENAVGWMNLKHQYVVICNEGDKVLVYEKGPCLFVFNFHPTNSYEGYQVGHSLGSHLTTILDTDEGRFGGSDRLSPSHRMAFPNLEGFNKRLASIKLYLPSRTGMVLIPKEAASAACLERFPVLRMTADEFIELLPKKR